jgi:hypothetical protein
MEPRLLDKIQEIIRAPETGSLVIEDRGSSVPVGEFAIIR